MSSSTSPIKGQSATATSTSNKRCIELVSSSNSTTYWFKIYILIEYFIFSVENEVKDTGKRTKKLDVSNNNDKNDE